MNHIMKTNIPKISVKSLNFWIFLYMVLYIGKALNFIP